MRVTTLEVKQLLNSKEEIADQYLDPSIKDFRSIDSKEHCMAAYLAHIHLPDAPRWYALYVRSRQERIAELALRGKGYAAFSPFCRTKRRRSDRTKELDVPLFPGYVFCQFDAARRLPVLTTPGVVTVVGAGNIPEPIENAEIASIQMIAESGRPVQPWPFLRPNQRVRIEAGPLCGTEGTLIQIKNEFRLIVSVSLLQRSVALEVDQDSVIPVF
jgi:transcription antitermination factor NusG